MVNMPIIKHKGEQPSTPPSPFAPLGLSDLPFPTEPVIKPQSTLTLARTGLYTPKVR